jgi:hypothetical protein
LVQQLSQLAVVLYLSVAVSHNKRVKSENEEQRVNNDAKIQINILNS